MREKQLAAPLAGGPAGEILGARRRDNQTHLAREAGSPGPAANVFLEATLSPTDRTRVGTMVSRV